MSQQDMQYGEFNRDRPGATYTGYEGIPPQGTPPPSGSNYSSGSSTYSAGIYEQKLSGGSSYKTPSTGQRLALAIVSLSLLAFMTFCLVIVAIAAHFDAAGGFAMFSVLSLFYVTVIIINVLFNRKH